MSIHLKTEAVQLSHQRKNGLRVLWNSMTKSKKRFWIMYLKDPKTIQVELRKEDTSIIPL